MNINNIRLRYAHLRPVRGPRPDVVRIHLGRVYLPGMMPTESLCRISMPFEIVEVDAFEEAAVCCGVCLAERTSREVKRAERERA